MQTKTLTTMRSSVRTTGWEAVASGTIGIFAIVSLIRYLILRSSNQDASIVMSRFHDVEVSIQFLLLIPVIVALQKMSPRQMPGLTQRSLTTGITLICFIVLFITHIA